MGTIDGKKGEKIGPKSGNFNVCATTEKPNAADSKKSLDWKNHFSLTESEKSNKSKNFANIDNND